MKLLIVTQAVNEKDPVLGFFCRWVEELAERFEHVEVICLTEGEHALPGNVRVHSLGKERGSHSSGTYALRFLRLAWSLRNDYDAVFVHMNQEYILIAGWLWKVLGKRVYMWRNHYAGSLATDIAAAFCTRVFCTSKHSYTAKYKKTIRMPVGVDTERFHPDPVVARIPRSILFLARIAPSKRPDMLIDALITLQNKGVDFTADIVGSPLPADEAYYAKLKERARPLGDRMRFLLGVPHDEAPRLFQSHEIFANASSSGMFDKTLFEAAACGCIVFASSEDFAELAGDSASFSTSTELAERLDTALSGSVSRNAPAYAEGNSLLSLVDRLAGALQAHGQADTPSL